MLRPAGRHGALEALSPVLVALAATGLLGCERNLDKGKIDGIARSMFTEQLGLTLTTLACPSPMPVEVGAVYECTADVDPEGKVPIDVKVTGGDGAVAVVTKYKVILPARLAEDVTNGLRQQNVAAKVDCGKAIQLAKPGATWKCSATGQDGAARPVIVTVGPDQTIAWRLE